MASSRDRRVAKELKDIQADSSNSGVTADLQDGADLRNLVATITGPPDTPYAGGTFRVKITIPDDYPFKPPAAVFLTKMWHPNISSQTGAICLDTLSTGWSPVQTIKTVLLSLRMLLEFPNPKDPQDAEVAKMMLEHPEDYAQKAQAWAVKYAGAPRHELDLSKYKKEVTEEQPKTMAERCKGYHPNLVNRFINMGFSVEAVVDAFHVVGIPRNGGHDYILDEAYIGDITAELLGDDLQ
ncbi:Ubiquitin-conjugating enzyme E2-like protein [Hapsidospora chrysogenum ATCC 11550]|uniref:Ubiquitin-conjugating enzyme E2 2 n=1 Tax=Hapsidospora chrysogenum (strain ATCC 11550 / CBS 779.69 / DSM 880 / IAM 14645 / JCM 23072 / IMI 49137) TaxID=857340 RepID=A0A086T7N5_HAPC1|nr:Ubiquitin-conjugating enzyme E2-like protein [Hapsidospora chrysogenum ATCC 11550]